MLMRLRSCIGDVSASRLVIGTRAKEEQMEKKCDDEGAGQSGGLSVNSGAPIL